MKNLVFVCLIMALASPAIANPGMAKANKSGEERFMQIDTTKDGQISWEEFSIALPQMRESAFKTIDKNQDGQISNAEWNSFQMGHSQDAAAAPMVPNSPNNTVAPMIPNSSDKAATPNPPAKPSIMPPKTN